MIENFSIKFVENYILDILWLTIFKQKMLKTPNAEYQDVSGIGIYQSYYKTGRRKINQ